MGSVGTSAVFAVLLLTCSLCSATVYVKDHSGMFASDTATSLELTAEGIAATVSTLGGSSLLTIDASAANQVAALVKPGLFSRPEAVLAIHVVGADEEKLSLAGWAQHSVAPCCDADRVARHLLLATPLATQPQCDTQCMSQGQEELISLLGSHAAGVLSRFGADVAPLLLGSGTGAEEQLWAAELVTALQLAQAGKSTRQYSATLVGLQAVRQKHGEGSEVFQAAQAATLAALSQLDALLADRHDGSLVSVLVASPPAALPAPSLPSLLRWKATLDQKRSSARQLLAADPVLSSAYAAAAANNATGSVHDMAVTASAWTLGLMLLLILLGTLWCMCGMEFKKDTLLFGVPKTRTD